MKTLNFTEMRNLLKSQDHLLKILYSFVKTLNFREMRNLFKSEDHLLKILHSVVKTLNFTLLPGKIGVDVGEGVYGAEKTYVTYELSKLFLLCSSWLNSNNSCSRWTI